ncbi:STAS domain-containing protein [Streptomyces sp. NPDC058291]|jgi:anti-anti-sigma factor|uniref:STAS domain-containing protein n=1 Tax=Streptomyces sp. NPDC058291 TaxID=3346427 RepID=UPI0036EC2A90
MTPYQPTEFAVTVRAADARTLRVAVCGDLDFETTDAFALAMYDTLHVHAEEHGPTLRDLHLDWAELNAFDSSGLSALLGLRRRAHAAGISLHLHHQPDFLTRMLQVTGIADYLTQRAHPDGRASAPSAATGQRESAPVS